MSVNKVILLGRLGQDPELRYTPNQTPVCTLNMATNEKRKTAEGEWKDETEWHRVVTFGKTAENCNQYLQKGRQAYVEGKIRTNKWQDKEGKDRYTTEILATTVQFIGGGKGEGSSSSTPYSGGSKSSGGGNTAPDLNIGETVSFDDDDIPF
jgi:single-strand DNA-binding protein